MTEKYSNLQFYGYKNDALLRIEALILEHSGTVLITDANVAQAQSGFLDALKVSQLVIAPGEKTKNMQQVEAICDFFNDAQLDRGGLVIAFGGGVVTDVAAFAASIYLRGVSLLLVPTSLLCMVDASIGGKTGVDTAWGKNQIGSFYSAENVLICPQFLETLPEMEVRNGIAEMLKHGTIADENHFADLSDVISKPFALTDIIPYISRSIEIKTEMVQVDPNDKNQIREKLNLGHTFAHAIEQISDYSVPHGKAVAWGLLLAAELGKELKITTPETVKIIEKAVCDLFPEPCPYSPSTLFEYMKTDKKRENESIRFLIPNEIGNVVIKPTSIENPPSFFT